MQNNSSNSIKIKSLSIYTEDKEAASQKSLYVTIPKEKTEYEKTISSVREVGFEFADKFSEQKERTVQFYQCGVAHARSTLEYIRSETNILPKFTFISLSAAAGYIFSFRRTKLRRFFHTAIFAAGSTAICYPHEAKKYSGDAYEWTKETTKAFYYDFIMPKAPKPVTPVQVDAKDKVLTLKPSKESVKTIEGDKGQSHDDDKDMYTTRK